MASHIVVPDTQSKPGAPNEHLDWIGRYALERRADTVIHLGDHFDMESLSRWDKGKLAMEGRRYAEDVEKGNADLDLIQAPTRRHNAKRRCKDPYNPRWVFLMGNHENRIERAIEDNGHLDGAIGYDDLALDGWEVHDFLEVVDIDSIYYSHYFYNPMTGRPYGGQSIDTRLKTIGHSFTMGHQQGLLYGLRQTVGGMQHGLVAGSAYLHTERYLGPQGNDHWRGIIVCHQVENGQYDPMFVSLEYLCRRYTGAPLADFMAETYPDLVNN